MIRQTSVRFLLLIAGMALALMADASAAQRGRGRMGMGLEHRQDMVLIQFLIEHKDAITRTVTGLPNGVETVTESTNPEVAATIREHVAAMTRRIETGSPIHVRDPLFREIFAHAREIRVRYEATANGVRVTETSEDAYVGRLIKAHAAVVTKFIENGHTEMMRDHPVPPR